jgi:hypothetical protein
MRSFMDFFQRIDHVGEGVAAARNDLPLGIEARASLPLLLYQLAKTGQDEFAVFFSLFGVEW